MEAQNACEEFCHGSHGRDGDGYGAPDSVCGTSFTPLSFLTSNTQLEKVKKFTQACRIKFLVSQATIKYNECTDTTDIEQNLEYSKEKVDEVSDQV